MFRERCFEISLISPFVGGTPSPETRCYLLENVLRVDSAGRELRPASSQHAQESFTALVDERDFVQVDDASALHISAVVLPPAHSELTYPGVRKPAMKNPSLVHWCFTEIDLQHAISLRACAYEEWATAAMACFYPGLDFAIS
jgi:hypothetical protein